MSFNQLKLRSRLLPFFALAAVWLGVGCATSSRSEESAADGSVASQPTARPGRSPTVPATSPDLIRNREKETSSQVLAYPTGERETSVVLLEKVFPTQARLGQVYKYQLKVTNLTDWPVAGVVVREDFPPSFAVAKDPNTVSPGAMQQPTVQPITGSDAGPATVPASADVPAPPADPASATAPAVPPPPPGREAQDVRYVQNVGYVRDVAGTWWGTATRRESRGVIAQEYLIGTLEPRQVKLIDVAGISDELGKLDTRSTVTYTPVLAGGTDVINPILKLIKEGPRHADLCDPIEFRYVISNIGVGTETDVQISENLPEGLLTEDGKSSVKILVGDLPQDQAKSYAVRVRAAKTGEYVGKAQAKGFGTSTQSTELTTAVHAPKLTIVMTGPDAEYVGKPALYEMTIKNVGDAAARNTTVNASADGGAALTFLTDAGTAAPSRGVYAAGVIEPGQSRKIRLTARPSMGGPMNVGVTAKADCADAVSASASTTVKVIAAVTMDVTDSDDPMRVGEAVTYSVVVKNQGSGPDRNLRLVATLPTQLKYVAGTGPTPGKVDGQKVTFDQLDRLDPGQSVTWLIEVKAAEEGDARFRVDLTSESLAEPVIATQSTRLY